MSNEIFEDVDQAFSSNTVKDFNVENVDTII